MRLQHLLALLVLTDLGATQRFGLGRGRGRNGNGGEVEDSWTTSVVNDNSARPLTSSTSDRTPPPGDDDDKTSEDGKDENDNNQNNKNEADKKDDDEDNHIEPPDIPQPEGDKKTKSEEPVSRTRISGYFSSPTSSTLSRATPTSWSIPSTSATSLPQTPPSNGSSKVVHHVIDVSGAFVIAVFMLYII